MGGYAGGREAFMFTLTEVTVVGNGIAVASVVRGEGQTRDSRSNASDSNS